MIKHAQGKGLTLFPFPRLTAHVDLDGVYRVFYRIEVVVYVQQVVVNVPQLVVQPIRVIRDFLQDFEDLIEFFG